MDVILNGATPNIIPSRHHAIMDVIFNYYSNFNYLIRNSINIVFNVVSIHFSSEFF